MARILYDGRNYQHPAALTGMRERTITIGSISKEYRMIGWRVRWVVGPSDILREIGLVGISDVVVAVGIAQAAAAAALSSADASRRLFEIGRIAATPMDNWGALHGSQYVRLVFSNEPESRLAGIGDRFHLSLFGR